ncbi:hypothetical protein P8452_46063 [Trifolium repens]|nr:hypothetical protein P8452_46063 [Trifolium repens]
MKFSPSAASWKPSPRSHRHASSSTVRVSLHMGVQALNGQGYWRISDNLKLKGRAAADTEKGTKFAPEDIMQNVD